MRYKLLACKVLNREIASLLWHCPNDIDLTLISQKLHLTPRKLQSTLQQEIDMIDAHNDPHSNDLDKYDVDAILLGFGFCSKAVEGLSSQRYPLVIPRIHDCISLLFGDRQQHPAYAAEHPGCYYYAPGWADIDLIQDQENLAQKRAEYMERFDGDEETVDFLLQAETEMTASYDRLLDLTWPDIQTRDLEQQARQLVAGRNWQYIRRPGNNSMLADLLWGRWDEENFLIVPPNKSICRSFDSKVLSCE